LTAAPTPFTVLPSAPRSYVWDATLTAGKYAFSVYGPDGFLTSFAGTVVPAGQNSGAVPVVTAALKANAVKLTLANDGKSAVVYSVTRNDYEGSNKKVTVPGGSSKTVSWPVNQDGYYDVVITASTSDGFRRRYAGRVA
ncbi:MAG TPA: phospholipase domain-containing protein, partial [Streptosporangiaceae bacterium]|nr:phospholipase domain-containing protein [Streptosporangiaceae bacterium]